MNCYYFVYGKKEIDTVEQPHDCGGLRRDSRLFELGYNDGAHRLRAAHFLHGLFRRHCVPYIMVGDAGGFKNDGVRTGKSEPTSLRT